MSDRDEGLRISRLLGGALLLVVGAMLALRNVGVLPGSNLGDYSPLLFVAWGAWLIFESLRRRRGRDAGAQAAPEARS